LESQKQFLQKFSQQNVLWIFWASSEHVINVAQGDGNLEKWEMTLWACGSEQEWRIRMLLTMMEI
jgi:hypothetical protein